MDWYIETEDSSASHRHSERSEESSFPLFKEGGPRSGGRFLASHHHSERSEESIGVSLSVPPFQKGTRPAKFMPLSGAEQTIA